MPWYLSTARGPAFVGGEGKGELVVIAGEQPIEIGRASAGRSASGLKLSSTPSAAAVPGINCIRPRAPVRLTARALPPLSALTRLASRFHVEVVFAAGFHQHLVQIGGVEAGVGASGGAGGCGGGQVCFCRWVLRARVRGLRLRVGNLLDCGDFCRRELDVVVLACGQIEADAAFKPPRGGGTASRSRLRRVMLSAARAGGASLPKPPEPLPCQMSTAHSGVPLSNPKLSVSSCLGNFGNCPFKNDGDALPIVRRGLLPAAPFWAMVRSFWPHCS